MKKLLPLSWMLMLITNQIAFASEGSAVSSTIQSWAEAFNENNPDVIVSFYENTESLDVLVSAGLWHQGISEVRAAYEKDKANIEYYDSTIDGLRIREMGDFAIAGFEHKFKIRPLQGKGAAQIHIRTTMTLRKISGVWKIVSEHSSSIDGVDRFTPIQDTGR